MTIFRRIKNLWELSAYQLKASPELLDQKSKVLVKDFPTMVKRSATIIPPDKPDIFEAQENGD